MKRAPKHLLMRPGLQKLLLLRRSDLIRWGRPAAIGLVIISLLNFGGAWILNSIIDGQLVPLLAKRAEVDSALVKKLDKKGELAAANEYREWIAAAHEAEVAFIGAYQAILVGAMLVTGLVALHSAAVTWRAYDLALDAPDRLPSNVDLQS